MTYLLQEGLEHALRLRETAIESVPPYVPDTNTGEDVQADARAAHQIATAEMEIAADTAWALEKRRLYRNHRDALKAVEEWRVSLRLMNERERQRTQRERLMAAIQEVQECATNRRRDAQEPAEDLLNDTVVRNWMPWLFDAMVGPDARPRRQANGSGSRR
jgi:hypothetical protein